MEHLFRYKKGIQIHLHVNSIHFHIHTRATFKCILIKIYILIIFWLPVISNGYQLLINQLPKQIPVFHYISRDDNITIQVNDTVNIWYSILKQIISNFINFNTLINLVTKSYFSLVKIPDKRTEHNHTGIYDDKLFDLGTALAPCSQPNELVG